VETKVLNQAVKRNATRFPSDFMLRLNSAEADELRRIRSQFVTLKRGEHRKYLPYAFTEHGALMLANVLNSERAAQTSVQVVRAFVRLRQLLSSNAELARKMESLEKKCDTQFRAVFQAIRKLMTTKPPKRREIGFHVKYEDDKPKVKKR
jgi:phage regulator Rha-like protein